MNCPYCASPTKVTNSRDRSYGTQVWRRRECLNCKNIWTTHELVDMSKSHQVINSQNNSEPFYRDVLFISILDTLKHRKTALKDATYLTDTIIKRLLALKTPKVPTAEIKQAATTTLKNYDPLSAKLYTALHPKVYSGRTSLAEGILRKFERP